jgi:8-oxo-dGTP pyrophosphatase MutT (NUDIX family)
MRPPEPDDVPIRAAGVLLLIYPYTHGLTFTLTKRTNSVSTHRGQVSLPGGGIEPGDTTTQDAALREACEEVGTCEHITVLGALTPLYVGVSAFEIDPYVGSLPQRPHFEPNPAEVASIIEMPLTVLLDDDIKTRERWTLHGRELDVPFYAFEGHTIWGATAIILSEFEGRLRRVLGL